MLRTAKIRFASALVITLLFELILIVPALGQATYELEFHEVEGMYGRPLGKIRNITQDPFGNMWFSGEEEKCIYRYDGIKLTLYRKDNFNSNSLGGVNINEVYADDEGLIWVTFTGDGLDAFNPYTNTFTHYRHDEKNPKSIISDNVSVILKDSGGRVWVGTDNGLDLLNVEKGEFTHFQSEPGNDRSLSHNFVSTIYEDRHGVIWIATAGYPWIVPNEEDGGLNRLEPDGSFTRYKSDPNDEHSLTSNKVLALYEDSRGVFWVGTNGDGLHTLDRKTGRFERHRHDPSNPQKLSKPPVHPECGPIDITSFIVEDQSGAIWIGSMCSGMNRYDPATGITVHYDNSNGFQDGTTWNAFVSRDGVLWVSTQTNKLYRTNPVRQVIPKKDFGFAINRFQENPDGTLWAGSQSGLLLLDKHGTLLKKIELKDKDGVVQRIGEVHRDSPEVLWLSTQSGIYVLNTRTEKYHALDLGVKGNGIIKIVTDLTNPDWKWISMMSGGGLLKYSKTKGLLKQYLHNKDDSTSLPYDHTIHILNENDYIWTTTAHGISRLDKKTDRFKNYLALKGTFIFQDARGAIWAGSENGLFQYDAEIDAFRQTEYHSVIATDRTFGITEDDHSNLWISTPSFIVRIDSARQVVNQFGSQNGIQQNSNVPGSIYKTSEGKILVGYFNGYYTIDPGGFTHLEKHPQVFITNFLINSGEDTFDPVNILKTPVDTMSSVTLSHDQNNFSIGFVLSDYRNPHGNHFQARLLGHDNTWRELTSQNSSNYFAIPPGEYTYELRGYTYTGSMTQKSIDIVISPPWWKTWWAYGCYVLIVVGLLIGARMMIVRDERLKANLQLEHLNFEKAKEVERVRTSFFTNISHEFRTPLTLIKGPVQELLEKHASDPRTTEKLKLISRNSDLLLKLINQLLDLARVEAGSLKLEKNESDIYSFLRVTSASFESFARQKGVSLSVEVPVIVKSVEYDKGKVEMIIINLINNAIKFTPLGGSVHIKARVEESTLWLSVSDTGIGISKEQQAKIFERFHQVSEAHKEIGTGIGLSLVKELVTFMDGTIEVISEEKKGSEFIVRLPIEIAVSGEGKPIEISQTPSVEGVEDMSLSEVAGSNGHKEGKHFADTKPHILVVEDNVEVRSFIIDCLGSEYNFLEADNGASGFHTAIGEIPDMIISDVMMPEMDGIEMTQKLKADMRTSHIPLIMLTAKSTEDSKLQGLRTGADDYLTKPFNKNELLLKVRNGISRQLKLREKLRAEVMSSAPGIEVTSQDERFLKLVKEKILARLNDGQLSVESLADDMSLSRSQLLRKVTALTGMSVNELIRKLRLQRAAQLITQNWGPISQVSYEVGFPNPSYFAKMFKEEFGVLPSEYLDKVSVRS